MVLIGIDYGLKHIGVSVGDTVSGRARPLLGFSYRDDQWVTPLSAVILRWQPEKIVVGMPYNADGTPQLMTEKVKGFVCALEQEFGIPVVSVDERWTTVSAKAELYASNKSNRVSKSSVDAESAKLILEQWLIENA